MEFRQLKTFRVVAEKLNFTRASEQLNMAQSSVSAQISNLEDELDVKLFDRIGRKVFLTDAGSKLYDYARKIEGITDEVRSALTEDSYARGSLTIRIPETLATVYMPEIISRYHLDFPGVKLNCINCSDNELPRELNTGRIDLAFLMNDSVALKDVNVRYLKSEKLTVLAAPDHRLAFGHPCTLADLNGETILLPITDWSYRRAFERSLDEEKIGYKVITYSSMNSLRACAALGVGLTICPEVAVRPHIDEGLLKRVNIKIPETSVIMIWHSEKWCSPLLKRFMELAENRIR